MSQSQAQLDRVFLRPQHAIFYRRVRRMRWQADARAEYSALFLLGGKAAYETSASAGEIQRGGALLIDPGLWAKATAQEWVEYLWLTLAPSYVLDCAVRTRLAGPGNSVTFRTAEATGDDRRLS
jgi:hypothetical protein